MKTNSVDYLRDFFEDIKNYKTLSDAETKKLCIKYHDGDDSVRNDIICGNLGLVVTIAKQFHCLNYELSDRIQEGVLGLIKAIEHYNPYTSNAFSTYAAFWIKKAIREAKAEKYDPIRVPRYIEELYVKIQSYVVSHKIDKVNDRVIDDIANELGESRKKIVRALSSKTPIISLYTPVTDDGSTELIDVIEDNDYGTTDEVISNISAKDYVRKARKVLNKNEYEIVSRIIGLASGEPESFTDVSNDLGISQYLIKRTYENAISKLRNSLDYVEDYTLAA